MVKPPFHSHCLRGVASNDPLCTLVSETILVLQSP